MAAWKLIFEKMGWCAVGLLFLLVMTAGLSSWQGVQAGEWWWVETKTWLWLSVAAVIVHQMYAWFAWRTELHLGLLSRWFGRRAFLIYAVCFGFLLAVRLVLLIIVGYANRGSWDISPVVGWGMALLILAPVIFTFHSVIKYFSLKRSLGVDHFDPSYRKLGLVREGIYKYTSNAIYVFAALLLWFPALLFGSQAALVAALFNHAALWVHYYTLEMPDMERIYGAKEIRLG